MDAIETIWLLLLRLAISFSPAFGQDILFEQRVQWIVISNGVASTVHLTETAAQADAIARKRANPVETVGIFQQAMQVAVLVEASPSPTPPTPVAEPTNPVSVSTSMDDLVFGYDSTLPDPSWTKPEIYQPYLDPSYGTTITRVTSVSRTDDGTAAIRFDRNSYSRRQPESVDGTYFLTYHGDSSYHVYERRTGDLVWRLTSLHPDSEPQWHPTVPHQIRYLEGPNASVGDLILLEIDLVTGESTTLADLRSRIRDIFPAADYMKDRSEGSPSQDGNRYAWIVYDENESILGLVSYDLATDQLLGSVSMIDADLPPNLDAISMSPSGLYIVAQFWTATYVFDADYSNRRLIFENAEHSDIAIGANGNDFYVYIDFGTGWLTAVDLVTLQPSLIFDLYDDANTSIHISGKGYAKPGWVIASTYNCKETFAWSCRKVMAVELVANGRVLNLAHTYNCGESYWTETHATVNRNFTRVYFNSDGGSCGIDAEVYIIDVPPFE